MILVERSRNFDLSKTQRTEEDCTDLQMCEFFVGKSGRKQTVW